MSRCATQKHLKEVHFKNSLVKTMPFKARIYLLLISKRNEGTKKNSWRSRRLRFQC